MTRDDIIRMAREAGLEVFVFDGVEEIGVGDGYHIQTDLIERFAALVAAAEREACAKVCLNAIEDADIFTLNKCAAAILARSKK